MFSKSINLGCEVGTVRALENFLCYTVYFFSVHSHLKFHDRFKRKTHILSSTNAFSYQLIIVDLCY
jgi:hypothetical protein